MKLMFRKAFSALGICGALALTGCSFFDYNVKPLAKVGDASLYPDDVKLGLAAGVSAEDSARLAEAYIKNWCVEQLMYEKAKDNVTDLDEIDLLVEKYRKSLMIYEYQLQLIGQNLNRPISTSEVQKFYTDNKELYTAQETLFQGLFLVIPAKSVALGELRAQVRQSDINMMEIDRVINKYSLKVKYYDEQWTPLAAVKRQGLFHLSKSHDFGRTHYVEESDEENTYMLIVQDFILAGAPQPFDYVKERISNMLNEQRKADYLRDLSEKLYKDAKESGKIKFASQDKK
ncbi:MAG: hypothetical protein MJZ19_05830 [Paludibacteraceae bacterium]|nr:hypothetical protein [Paludibacteraceae bacterium]